jgi:DNA-binding LytR/AlgR family response regulator
MGKKKKAVIDLSDADIVFMLQDQEARVISFDPNSMTVILNLYEQDRLCKQDRTFPFAHLPKPIKKLVRPL